MFFLIFLRSSYFCILHKNNTEICGYFRSVIKRNFFVKWYESNGREFPWREPGTTPYQFLVTEVLLQQTKAPDVAAIWHNFFAIYPDIKSLSNSDAIDLFNLIKHLGFGNLRVRALQSIARWLIENHDGEVPNSLEDLLAIPYVGDYAARAVLCFAYDQRVEIVDTNVLRLFSRYFLIKFKPDIRRAPQAWEIAREIFPRERKKAKAHNYGILDFTAEICKSGKPRCEACPLNKKCAWGRIQSGLDEIVKMDNSIK